MPNAQLLLKNQLVKKIEARDELFLRQARDGNFKSFCLYMDYNFFARRVVLGKVADVLQKVHDAFKDGKPIKVAISLSPRAGKSYLVSLFAAFMLGRFPIESVMRNSCTAKLYEKLSKDTRDIVDSDKFRAIFAVVLETKGVVSWGLVGARQTSYFGAGVDGTIIGFGATMLAISDDLYKGIADAMSDVINEFVLGWYDAAASSRMEKNCCTVDIGTRWRSNDVIGRNEAAGKYDYVIRIPALNSKGESFCEDVRTTEQYLETKASISEEIWDAEYMQEPKDIKGALFRKDELEYYRKSEIEGKAFDANVGVCDMADEGSDNLSAPMVKKIGGKYYLYNVLFTTERTEVTEPLLKGELRLHNVHMMRFESNNGGKLFAQNVAEDVETVIDWKTSTTNKETRILVDSGWIKKNIVFLMEGEYPKHSDYARFMENLTKYIKGVKNAHDDAPDSLSLLRRWLDEIGLNNCDAPIPESDRWSSVPIGVTQMQL